MLVAVSWYQIWFFVHLLGVFGLFLAHGISAGVALKLRSERDPRRIDALLQLSGSAVPAFYVSLLVLLVGGVVAGFMGSWWRFGWIWASVGILVAIIVTMYTIAGPYYRRVRTIVAAMARGSEAVSDEQLESILRAPSALWNAIFGFAAMITIPYLMVFKPF